MSVLTGQVGASAAIVGGVASVNRIAAVMTNPVSVRWLAKTTKMPPGAIPAQINILAQQAKKLGDEDLAWFVALLEEQFE